MAYEMLLQEAQGMSEDALMEVIRFMRFIKLEGRAAIERKTSEADSDRKNWIRRPGGLNGNAPALRCQKFLKVHTKDGTKYEY